MATTKQIGGWYPNPEQGGKVMRYWGSFGWTTGSDPTGGRAQPTTTAPTVTNTASAGTPMALAGAFDQKMQEQINKYADALITQAKGDLDFASKWIENTYKEALGTDNRQQADFLKAVASNLESKVGTIAYDYQTGKYRLEQELAQETGKLTQNKNLALQRLAEDERVYNETFARQQEKNRELQNTELNQRGLISGTREGTTGLGAKEILGQERTAQDTLSAYQRELARNREETNLGFERGMQGLTTSFNRASEDLTTNARRNAQNQITTYQSELEARQRDMEKARIDAEIKRKQALNQAPTYTLSAIERGISSGVI